MRVYVTKYALTEGILTMEAELCHVGTMIEVKPKSNGFTQYFHNREWYTDLEAAKARAEEMRQNKIKSVKKQLQKLEEMRFE